jgi:hypothetical protein
MTPRQVFELMADLESDLADFYQHIGQIENLKTFADIFSFMTDHSERHAARIRKMARTSEGPVLSTAPVKELHERLKTSLLDQIRDEPDGTVIMSKLAQTEEVVGQLYQSIADHYRKLSAANAALADQFEKLSSEEFGHRDTILEELS